MWIPAEPSNQSRLRTRGISPHPGYYLLPLYTVQRVITPSPTGPKGEGIAPSSQGLSLAKSPIDVRTPISLNALMST